MKSTPVPATCLSVSSVTPPRRLQGCAAADVGDRGPQLIGRHVVQQQRCRARGERLVDLGDRPALDLERQLRGEVTRPANRGADTAGQGRVVLLDQDRVVQARAVIGRSTGRHRRLLEGAQPRGRLARVEDHGSAVPDCVGYGSYAPGGHRRHARQPLEKVQRGPLARQQRPRAAGHPRHLATLTPDALVHQRLKGDRRIERREHQPGRLQSEDHPRRLLRDQRGRADVLGHRSGSRDVTRADVLGQRPGDDLNSQIHTGARILAGGRSPGTLPKATDSGTFFTYVAVWGWAGALGNNIERGIKCV